MADWSAIRTALQTWVGVVTGLTCYWRRRPRPAHFGDAYALLSITGRRTVGNDDVITEYDDTQPAGQEIRRYQAGQRQFTFPVQVRCQRTSDDTDALHYTSLIRDSVCMHGRTEAAFREVDVSFARILSETDIDVRLDNRDMSVAQIDLLMNAVSITEDIPTGHIEVVNDFEFFDVDDPAPPLWVGDIEVN